MKQCPECKRQFADADTFCPFDGGRLVEAEHAPGALDYMVGTTLDARYKIERRLGEGGMGVVFLAHHIVIEKLVAIKVLKREVARDQSVVRRFIQEAKAASRVGHPNIVDVTDFGTTPDGMTYSVMEYVEGATLSAALREHGRMFVSRAVPIVTQIGRALSAAHAKGIVHRDLKPDNIFLSTRGGHSDFVKIVDFGIAKVTSLTKDPTLSPRLTRQGTVFGTPEYMPPEQAAGLPDTDHRVDIYALGTILYELIVGRVPHKGDSLLRTLTMQINDPIVPPSKAAPELELSEPFEAVVMRALAKDRDQRFQSMTELVNALGDVAGDLPAAVARRASQPAQRIEPPVAGPQDPTLSPARAQGAPPAPDTIPEADAPDHLPGDPMFTGRGRPETLRRFDDLHGAEPLERRRERSRLPALIAIALAIGALAVGIAAMLKARAPDDARPVVAQAPAIDAGALAVPPPADAAAPPADAAVALALPDAGRRRKPGGKRTGGTPERRIAGPAGMVSIVVETRPHGGTLYMSNGSYGGTDGTTVTRRGGQALWVECRLSGYAPGRTELIFDGKTDIALCQMKRLKKCIPGVKNPFDDCTQ